MPTAARQKQHSLRAPLPTRTAREERGCDLSHQTLTDSIPEQQPGISRTLPPPHTFPSMNPHATQPHPATFQHKCHAGQRFAFHSQSPDIMCHVMRGERMPCNLPWSVPYLGGPSAQLLATETTQSWKPSAQGCSDFLSLTYMG